MRAAFLTHHRLSPATRSQLRAVSALGIDVTAIIPARDSCGGQPQYGMEGEVRVVPVASRGNSSEPRSFRWKRSAIRRALQEARPDVIHVDVEPHLRMTSALLGEARRLGVAVTAGTALESRASLTWRERRRRSRNLRQARGIHAATPRAAALAGEERDAPILMAPRVGVITPSEVAPFSPEGLSMAFSGRLVPELGLDQLLRAAVGINGTWQLLVAAGGPAQPELEALAERLGISGRVAWLGALPLEERAGLWSRADCAVDSWSETDAPVGRQGIAALQAMAAGRPVVATRTDTMTEFVGDTGLLVDPGDPAPMASALQRLLDDTELRQSLGAAARQRVMERYSTQAVARRAVDLWHQALSGV